MNVERYALRYFTTQADFLAHIEAVKHELDCLVLYSSQNLLPALSELYERGLILPIVAILSPRKSAYTPEQQPLAVKDAASERRYLYQPSEIVLTETKLAEIGNAIEQAITKFLSLTPILPIANETGATESEIAIAEPSFLLQQQRRLADKLKERLGYLAVYYKRNPQQYFRHLDRQQQQELLHGLKSQYRKIVLEYFSKNNQIDDLIDELVGTAFFSDLSVSEIVKIHMELMEEFSNQLKLEGRSEEILLDYRLTLIDVIAHLCEMYRRSIPREM